MESELHPMRRPAETQWLHRHRIACDPSSGHRRASRLAAGFAICDDRTVVDRARRLRISLPQSESHPKGSRDATTGFLRRAGSEARRECKRRQVMHLRVVCDKLDASGSLACRISWRWLFGAAIMRWGMVGGGLLPRPEGARQRQFSASVGSVRSRRSDTSLRVRIGTSTRPVPAGAVSSEIAPFGPRVLLRDLRSL